ncbi:MAG: hypothetical protein CMK24_05840 [Porticoccaceae bacterium]|nr:hypothetical protein [Porticoccaceae bacterium]
MPSQIPIDVNGDGFDDLAVGWGHGSTSAFDGCRKVGCMQVN